VSPAVDSWIMHPLYDLSSVSFIPVSYVPSLIIITKKLYFNSISAFMQKKQTLVATAFLPFAIVVLCYQKCFIRLQELENWKELF
jgi:hypothetical protein